MNITFLLPLFLSAVWMTGDAELAVAGAPAQLTAARTSLSIRVGAANLTIDYADISHCTAEPGMNMLIIGYYTRSTAFRRPQQKVVLRMQPEVMERLTRRICPASLDK
jgi:hypothetical protein